ncbi:MAG: hypothetical protein Q8P93_04295 [bacterium]|nr:hypothetical protein [bacterium]
MDKEQQGSGPLIGIIIIVLILVLGGIYYAGKTQPAEQAGPTADEIRTQDDPYASQLSTQGSSDETAAIEADLEASNFDDLDAELSEIDAELEAR